MWCRGVPRSAEWCREGVGQTLGKLLYYHCNTTKIDRVEQPRTVCGAEECRGVLSGAGKGWGRHWGAFKLLKTVCGARSAEECRLVLGRGGADIGEPLNYSTTIAIPLK